MDYALILSALYADALWGLTNNDLSTLTWDESNADPMPDAATLDAAWPAVQTERGWAAVRAERDRLLAESDWTQVADAPLTAADKQAWADYRQALRDVPQDFGSPDEVVWPDAP
jgi:hypothetical protein